MRLYKESLVAKALASAFGITVLTCLAPLPAIAQTNTTGTIYGKVAADTGLTISIINIDTNAKRILPVDSDGRFQSPALPTGRYSVQLIKMNSVISTSEVEVLIGQGVEALLGGAAQAVQITAQRNTIDVSSTTNGSTFTAKQLENLPLQQNFDAIIQLAANTTKADPRYEGGASIGGGAPSENSYYINGFPATNALTQLGSMELPFGAIAQAQVLTGGFGAEFGRSVGGVVNIITKSGTNKWEGGVNYSIEPNSLRSKSRNIYYPVTGSTDNAETDGTIYLQKDRNSATEYSYGGYVGGPIIPDTLFFFFAADQTKKNSSFVNATPSSATVGSSGWVDSVDTNTRYMGKLDWNLTDRHRLELTLVGDNYQTKDKYYAYDYELKSKVGGITYTDEYKNLGGATPGVGGDAQILKYAGDLTDNLFLTALYGQSSSKHGNVFSTSTSVPGVLWTSNGRSPDFSYVNPQPLAGQTIIPEGAKDTVKSFRLDVEYKLGAHTLRAGLDDNRLKSTNAGETLPGGSLWSYRYVSAFGGYVVRQRIFSTVTDAQSNQSAQYLEDKIQVTKDIMVSVGLRNESFENKNGDNQTFLESKNLLSPRLAASWDALGDQSLKIFGTAGRYSLQIPTHVAVRGASRSTYTDQYFTYTGVDPTTGLPLGTAAVPGYETPVSVNNEYGQAKDPLSVAARNIKPTFQDELTLGFEKAYSPEWTYGGKVTYRTLKSTIDDLCDYRPFDAYGAKLGLITDVEGQNDSGFGCASFNPGEDNTFLFDYANKGVYTPGAAHTVVKLSASDLGFDKVKRTYMAFDVFLEHPLRNGWYGKLTYTYSKSKGNTEGQTKSDNAQTDVAVTSSWDTPELMENIYGLLPNDRTHQIKAQGFLQVTPEWGISGTFLAASGRPRNCVGNYPYTTGSELDQGNLDYGSVYFYCNGVASPRGSAGRLPWDINLDVGVTYKPEYIKGLALKVDIFNLFNRQSAQVVDETRESAFDPTSVSSTYGRVVSYTAPRSVKFTAQYDF